VSSAGRCMASVASRAWVRGILLRDPAGSVVRSLL
jgi:hypothetical protein